jgi:hypothetical protein
MSESKGLLALIFYDRDQMLTYSASKYSYLSIGFLISSKLQKLTKLQH